MSTPHAVARVQSPRDPHDVAFLIDNVGWAVCCAALRVA